MNKTKKLGYGALLALLATVAAHAEGIDLSPVTGALDGLSTKLVAGGALVIAAAMSPLGIKYGVRWLKGLWKASAS